MSGIKDQIKKWGVSVKITDTPDSVKSNDDPVPPTDETVVLKNSSNQQADPKKLESSDQQASRLKSDLYKQRKARLHQQLISKFDLGSLEKLTPEQLRFKIKDQVVRIMSEEELTINEHERQEIIVDLQNEIMGLGPLELLLADPSISEIMINNHDTIYVEKKGRLERSPVVFDDDNHLLRIIDRIVSRVGRRIDESSPMCDARLPDGSRVNAIIPPLAIDGPCLTIRRFSSVPLEMHNLIEYNSISSKMAEVLAAMVKCKINILISGGTGSGKTTLLNILSSYIPENERIITIEDTAELQMQQPHVVRLETRPPNIEGKGEVSMRTLVKNSLRMRPNRIVVGEVRGEEVIDMLQAMNTGHDGSLATIHANNVRDSLGRLENLMSMSGVSMAVRSMRQQICSAINVIVQISRMSDGTRKVVSIAELTGMEGDTITMQEIFKYEQQDVNADGQTVGHFVATGVRPRLADILKIRGANLPGNIFEPDLATVR